MKGHEIIGGLQFYATSKRPTPLKEACQQGADRIIELERGCGAAAIAMFLDTIKTGVNPADAAENSAVRMVCEAVGLDLGAGPDELIRFRNAYMARFKPQEDARDGR